MDHFEKFEEQLLSSYKSTLAIEGEEICEKIDSSIQDDYDFLIEKASTYCFLYTDLKKDPIDKNLIEKCKKYLDDLRNYSHIKVTLKEISRARKMA